MCQHFRGKLIAHALADLMHTLHKAGALTRWYESVTGLPRYSLPDKTFGIYLKGAMPAHARRQQFRQLCPGSAHWIDHPLYEALSPQHSAWTVLFDLIDDGRPRLENGARLFKQVPSGAVDVDLAIVLMVIRNEDNHDDRLRVQCCRFLPTLLAVACHLTPLGYVSHELLDLINDTIEVDHSGHWWNEGWPETYAELDALIALWGKWIGIARQLHLVTTDQSAATFSRLVQNLSPYKRHSLIICLSTAVDEHRSIFHYANLRRLYHALRRHPPFVVKVGYPPVPSQLVD